MNGEYLDIWAIFKTEKNKLMRPKTHVDFLIKESQCQEALESFEDFEKSKDWLLEYEKLFWELTVSPKGYPVMIKSNFDGKNYPRIREFCNFFIQKSGINK